MKKPEDLAELISFQSQPVGAAAERPGPCSWNGTPSRDGFSLSLHGPDIAAEVVHDLEQAVREGGGAEAGDDGEIEARSR